MYISNIGATTAWIVFIILRWKMQMVVVAPQKKKEKKVFCTDG